jgi:glucose/arabinose dehydrogenase
MFRSLFAVFTLLCLFTACQAATQDDISSSNSGSEAAVGTLVYADNNDDLMLPEGFSVVVAHEGVGRARHITVNTNGDVYVKLSSPKNNHGLVAMRDVDNDGKMDSTVYFGPDFGGTGIDISNGYLYFSSDVAVYRVLLGDNLVPTAEPELIATGFNAERQHAAKSIALDDNGNLFVNVGAPSNACMEQMRTKGSPGMKPCPILEDFGGVWRFDANKLNQDQTKDGYRYATGMRHAVAIDWNHDVNELYSVMHGRDQLDQLFPDLYNAQQNAELPGEEFQLLTEGANHGWPYTYYDWQKAKRVVGPEYGGNGEDEPTEEYNTPIYSFPGHWAPNDLHFYKGKQFPQKYRKGAFVAFHGSWNRAPMPQRGYKVAFVPFSGNKPSGEHEDFADNFARKTEIATPSEAEHRPMGLAEAPDGSLYIVDSKKGKLWRIVYTGN